MTNRIWRWKADEGAMVIVEVEPRVPGQMTLIPERHPARRKILAEYWNEWADA